MSEQEVQPSPGDITSKLIAWSEGDPSALEELLPLVVDELRRGARFFFEHEDNDHTLQPTALVSELCLRLLGLEAVQWDNRRQFFGFAGQVMRRILIDYARGRKAKKRGAGVKRLSLTGGMDREDESSLDPETVLSIHQALLELEKLDPQAAKVVELRFFTGLTSAETAQALGLSRSTVTREWKLAKEFLARRLGPRSSAALVLS